MRLSFRVFILLLLFWILTYEVLIWWTTSMDESVYSWIMNTFPSDFTPIFKAFTHIWGTYWIPIVALILTSIFAYKKKYRIYAILTISTPVIIYFINTVIKNCIQRLRPDILRLISETWYSFPSWHTMHTVALYWLIILLSFYFIKNRSLKRTISLASLFIMACVATSRIYLWVHYFSDILWWVFLSLLYLFIIKHIFFTKKVA
jgi:undecaprenyl-diphosphatase